TPSRHLPSYAANTSRARHTRDERRETACRENRRRRDAPCVPKCAFLLPSLRPSLFLAPLHRDSRVANPTLGRRATIHPRARRACARWLLPCAEWCLGGRRASF